MVDNKKMTEQSWLSEEKNIDFPWKIIKSYFRGSHLEKLVRHQLESYNMFVNYQIQRTINMFNPVRIASEQNYDEETGQNSLEIVITFLHVLVLVIFTL